MAAKVPSVVASLLGCSPDPNWDAVLGGNSALGFLYVLAALEVINGSNCS